MGDAPHDVIVIGAGIVGASCAGELAADGLRTLLLEADERPAGTSCRAMGWLGPYDANEAQFALCRYGLDLWNALAPELPAPVEFRRTGSLALAAGELELREAERRAARYTAAGVAARAVGAEELRRLEPAVSPDLAGALFVPDDVILDAPAATRSLFDRAVARGAELRTRARVQGLFSGGVLLADGTRLLAARTVLAAGVGSPAVLPGLPVRPRKGHIVRTVPVPGLVRHQLAEVHAPDTEGVDREDVLTLGVQPRADGRHLLGTTRQYLGSSLEVDPHVVERIRRHVARFVPALAGVASESVWAGVRPAGTDPVPFLGPFPGRPELLLATGHEGIGITTSLASGRIVADLVAGRPPPIDVGPYLPTPARLRRALSGTGRPEPVERRRPG
jgi:glycine/D-amino acid oxidase-like deaminating enzyme